jgi:3',5'-cyclic AMP phosphodiesterase CpdA
MATENRAGPGDNHAAVFPTDGLTLARFDRPTADGTTLMVVSDPHLTATRHGTLKLYHRSKQRFQMAVADAHRLGVDAFLVAGDLTRAGERAELALAQDLLRTAPRPTVTVPGNHDITRNGLGSGDEFAEWRGEGSYPQSRLLDGLTIHTVDTTAPATRGGSVDADALQTVGGQTSGPQIAMMHHPVASVPRPFRSELADVDYRVENRQRLPMPWSSRASISR